MPSSNQSDWWWHAMMMMYFRKGGNLVKHAIIAISDDMSHDSYAVKVFDDLAFKNVLKVVPINIVQYKAKTAFCISSWKGRKTLYHQPPSSASCIHAERASTGNFKVQWNYFETSHGKSVCGGLGAITLQKCCCFSWIWKALVQVSIAAFGCVDDNVFI